MYLLGVRLPLDLKFVDTFCSSRINLLPVLWRRNNKSVCRRRNFIDHVHIAIQCLTMIVLNSTFADDDIEGQTNTPIAVVLLAPVKKTGPNITLLSRTKKSQLSMLDVVLVASQVGIEFVDNSGSEVIIAAVSLSEIFPEEQTLAMEIRPKVCEYVRLRIEALREKHPGKVGSMHV